MKDNNIERNLYSVFNNINKKNNFLTLLFLFIFILSSCSGVRYSQRRESVEDGNIYVIVKYSSSAFAQNELQQKKTIFKNAFVRAAGLIDDYIVQNVDDKPSIIEFKGKKYLFLTEEKMKIEGSFSVEKEQYYLVYFDISELVEDINKQSD